MAEQKTAVVTGGAGFIGSHLCERLVKEGYKVISLDNYFTGSKDNHVAGVEYREGHTKDIAKHVPENPDIIYHLGEYSRTATAMYEPDVVFDLNTTGTLGVLRYWKEKKCKLVYAGSSTKMADIRHDGIAGRDLSPYTISKAHNTELVKDYGTWYDLPYVIVYFFNVYGPRELSGTYGTVIEIFKQNIRTSTAHSVNRPGTQTRTYTHVLDTIDGIFLAGEKGNRDEYGICSNDTFRTEEIARMFGGPYQMLAQRKTSRPSTPVDNSKISSLGWRQKYSLKEYIKQFSYTPIKAKSNPMKKILIFSLAYYPSHVSGAEIAIKEITDRISPEDIEFHMVTLYFDTTLPRYQHLGNVHVHRVGFGGEYLSKIFFIPLAAWSALKLNRTHHFDALWGMMTYMSMPIALARRWGLNVPYLMTLQDGDPYEKVFERAFIKPFVWLIDDGFRNATLFQVISKFLGEWPTKRGYRGEVVLIPNGASMPSAQEYPKDELDMLRASLNVKEEDRLLVTVGRLTHQKAQDVVIRALTLLPENVRYIMVGEGELKEEYEKLAKELGVSHRVVFTGQVDRTMTAKYRKISDAFVMPSRSEGQGISFLSTMVSGLPMVATQEGGLADFLFDAKRNPDEVTTGWAVDVDSPEQVAAAVMDILDHPDKAKEVAANAKKVAHEKYSWDAIVKDMEKLVFSRVG